MSFGAQILIGVIVGLVLALIGWIAKQFWNNFWKKRKGYLLYEVRKFKLGKDEVLEVLCIWNPTNKDIKEEEITTDFESISNVISVTQLATTNKSLKDLISQNGDKAELFFENFPAKSGCVYALRSRRGISRFLIESGKINNEETRIFHSLVGDKKSNVAGYSFVSSLALLFIKGIQYFLISDAIFDQVISIFILLVLIASIPCYLIILKMVKKPKSLVDSFDGSE